MNLFGLGGAKGPDPEKVARDEASRQSIMAGGLPLNAIDRLSDQQRRAHEGKPFFTSDLSVNELLLTHECGFLPIGQVMGSCVYHIGWQYVPQSGWVYASQEMTVMTQSQMEARNLAFSRLRQEAKLLGADGVVGVRFTRQRGNFGTGELEFMAIGTAVKRIGTPPPSPPAGTPPPRVQHREVSWTPAHDEPFVSNLSGQDHWALRKAGYAPLGFVFGTCAWYQYPDWRSQNAMMSWSNMELTSLSQGIYTARELAIDRMELEANRLSAAGIVGVDFETYTEVLAQDQQNPGGFIMHFTAWGTAIGPDPHATDQPLNLNPVLPIGSNT